MQPCSACADELAGTQLGITIPIHPVGGLDVGTRHEHGGAEHG